VQSGLLTLAGADVVRLPVSWLVSHRCLHLREFIEEVRDPVGFARLEAHVDPGRPSALSGGKALQALARILFTQGGGLADITDGNAIEYDTVVRETGGTRNGCANTLFYPWLRELGSPDEPAAYSPQLCRPAPTNDSASSSRYRWYRGAGKAEFFWPGAPPVRRRRHAGGFGGPRPGPTSGLSTGLRPGQPYLIPGGQGGHPVMGTCAPATGTAADRVQWPCNLPRSSDVTRW
jgi:hypothetical protein